MKSPATHRSILATAAAAALALAGSAGIASAQEGSQGNAPSDAKPGAAKDQAAKEAKPATGEEAKPGPAAPPSTGGPTAGEGAGAGSDPAATAPAEAPGSRLSEISKLLPLGRPNRGVMIPNIDPNTGEKRSLTNIETLTRVDDEQLALEDMRIDMFDETGSPDVSIRIKHGSYHLPTDELRSDSRTKVVRKDFVIEADRMVFDTVKQEGKMEGRVEMTIYNFRSVQKAPPAAPGGGAESPSDAAPAPPPPPADPDPDPAPAKAPE